MIVIDKYCYTSGLRHVDPVEKFGYAMATLLVCVLTRSVWTALVVLTVNGILNVKKGGVPFLRYCRLMLVPLAFLLMSTAAVMVNISKVPMDAYALKIGMFYLTSSREDVLQGMRLILTAFASVSCLYFLSLNTPMTEILDVCRKLRCPQILIELMLLMYRFIFILLEVASAILTAQKARLGNKDLRTSVRSFGQMISVLFVRALKKSGALYDAMEARCYDGTLSVLPKEQRIKWREIVWIAGYEGILIAAALWFG